jgi:hypothetical protein
MKWAQEGAKIVCEIGFDVPNPIWEGRKFSIRAGRQVQIVAVRQSETGHTLYQVGWFDYGNGRREGFVEHTAEGLEHYWRPYEHKTPVAPRSPRPMILGFSPDIVSRIGMRTKRHIGYWATNKDPLRDSYETRGIFLPWPEDYIDPEWHGHERNLVIAHLRNAPDVARHKNFAACRICGLRVGSTDKSDDTYIWPSGLAHYVEDHGVRPPPEFVMHIIRYNHLHHAAP